MFFISLSFPGRGNLLKLFCKVSSVNCDNPVIRALGTLTGSPSSKVGHGIFGETFFNILCNFCEAVIR